MTINFVLFVSVITEDDEGPWEIQSVVIVSLLAVYHEGSVSIPDSSQEIFSMDFFLKNFSDWAI